MCKNYSYPAVFYKKGYFIDLYFWDIEDAYIYSKYKKNLWPLAKSVLKMSISYMIANKIELPEPTPIKDLKLRKFEQAKIISVKLDKNIEFIPKTILLPRLLDKEATKSNINLSTILIKGIKEELTLQRKSNTI